MSIRYGGKTIIESYGKLHVGDNGNFFVGKQDLGVKASTDIYMISEEDFNSTTKYGLYYVIIPGEANFTIAMYYIDKTGRKYAVTNSDYVIESKGDIAAMINDTITASDSTWSSKHITEVITAKLSEYMAEQPKSLEFVWHGTQLGIRQVGQEKYTYQDLKGSTGIAGVDGSSVIDARVDDSGNLILTVQDADETADTTKMLTLESGVFTQADLLDIINSINRINTNIAKLKDSDYRTTMSINTLATPTTVMDLTGSGKVQILVNKFIGDLELIRDGVIYKTTITSANNQGDVNVIAISPDGKLIMPSSLFDFNIVLDISFSNQLLLRASATKRVDDKLPSFLVQGRYFDSTGV